MMVPEKPCRICHRRMINVGEPDHPACAEPGGYRVRIGERLRDKAINTDTLPSAPVAA